MTLSAASQAADDLICSVRSCHRLHLQASEAAVTLTSSFPSRQHPHLQPLPLLTAARRCPPPLFFSDKNKSSMLDWRKRVDIIYGIARGLLYLHQDSRLKVIHRDLKAGNILLDENMNPKISDFGTATIFGNDQTEQTTRRIIGTFGYMSPEYAMDGIFSVKSDVFSFGVLLLEIVSGRKNRILRQEEHSSNLLKMAWKSWENGNSLELLDDNKIGSCSKSEFIRFVQIGLLCVQECAADRPTMASVAFMLSGDSSTLPDPERPGFIRGRRSSSKGESHSSTRAPLSYTINNVTCTDVEGR